MSEIQIRYSKQDASSITFRLEAPEGYVVPPEVYQAMEVIGEATSDGQVQVEEMEDLLAILCPHLADHPELALILKTADNAVKAVRGDGAVSIGEGLAILVPLLTRSVKAVNLGGLAETVVSGVLRPIRWLAGAEKKNEEAVAQMIDVGATHGKNEQASPITLNIQGVVQGVVPEAPGKAQEFAQAIETVAEAAQKAQANFDKAVTAAETTPFTIADAAKALETINHLPKSAAPKIKGKPTK